MPIDFPNSPTLNEIYTYSGKTWIWNGTSWQSQTSTTTSSATNLAGGAALNLPLPQIIALDNTAISFNSIDEMVQLLLQYGSARAQLSSVFANRRKAVEDATTIEEVGVI